MFYKTQDLLSNIKYESSNSFSCKDSSWRDPDFENRKIPTPVKKYIGAILSIGSIGLLFYTLFDLRAQLKQVPKLQQERDSLINELFIKQTELGRIEVSTNQVLSKYPKIYEEYTEYLQKETE